MTVREKHTSVCGRYVPPMYFVAVGLGMLFEDFRSNVLIPTLRELGLINRFPLRFSAHLGFERPGSERDAEMIGRYF